MEIFLNPSEQYCYEKKLIVRLVTDYLKCFFNEPAFCVQLTVLHLNDSIRTYLLSFIHWLPMNQLPWRTIPSDKQSTDQGTGRWVFWSNIHDQTLLFYHVLYGLLFIICQLWTIIISVWVGTCIYLHVAVLCSDILSLFPGMVSSTNIPNIYYLSEL